MIVGIGIDSVAVERFKTWNSYSFEKLRRIFSAYEIEYCRANPLLSAQRFAVRFAAREALFKAISQALPTHSIPFLTLCRATTITTIAKAPEIKIEAELLSSYRVPSDYWDPYTMNMLCSLSHTDSLATGLVILEKTP